MNRSSRQLRKPNQRVAMDSSPLKMTTSDRSKGDDPFKSFEFLGRSYASSLPDEERGSGYTVNELIGNFYESMFGYMVDRLEPLLPRPDDTSSSETNNMEMHNPQDGMAVRVTYKSGNVYEGYMVKWVPSGEGCLFLHNGVTYKGQFRNGFPGGTGVIRWPDTSWYEGEFRNGLRHGRGMHVSGEDGRRRYGGQWTDGTHNGLGQTDCGGGGGGSDCALDYDGHWVDGWPHGHGTGSWPDGTQYTGGWAHGRPHGRGKAVWPGDDVYDGDWVDGHMDGNGTYEWTSNPRNHDRLVICLCDKYTGQWSKSKKHGVGEFYSAETGSKVRGSWSDDVLNGPCEIVLCTGRRPNRAGLEFRQNVLYETSPPAPALARPPIVRVVDRDRGFPVLTAARGLSHPVRSTVVRSVRTRSVRATETTTPRPFRGPCKPVLPGGVVALGNDDVHGSDGAAPGVPRQARANIPLTCDMRPACDLTGHVRKLVAACSAGTMDAFCAAVDPESELRAAEHAIHAYADRLDRLYRTYGAFLADDGPVTYRPLLTRLGLWQMLIDGRLHARISLANFDDLLYGNADCAFNSAHDPFELVYFWQFVHAICELATFVYDVRQIRRQDARSAGCGLMASALHRLFTEHLRIDVLPESYAMTAEIGGERWTNDRRTVMSMYDVYRTMTAKTTEPPPLPTARRLIRLYGPRCVTIVSADGQRSASLESVLPAVLTAVLGLSSSRTPVGRPLDGSATGAFGCSVETVVALLREACPRIADARGALVDVHTRLVFAEWYRFVLLCVRDCRRHRGVPQPLPEQ